MDDRVFYKTVITIEMVRTYPLGVAARDIGYEIGSALDLQTGAVISRVDEELNSAQAAATVRALGGHPCALRIEEE